MKKIRLLLVEDNNVIRDGLKAIAKNNKDIQIIARSGELKKILADVKKLNPSVVIINLGLLSQSCFSVIEIIQSDLPSAGIIISGLEKNEEDILALVQAKVNGFVLKNSSPKEIIKTIRIVDSGATVLPPLLINQLFAQIVGNSSQRVPLNFNEKVNLTNRESEVIQFLGEGLSNKEIGSKMRISTYTVKSHIHNIMEKLSLHSRLEIANHSFDSISN